MTSSQPAQWNLLEAITLSRYRYVCGHGKGEGREGSRTEQHITSTFNDRSTRSCICLRLDLYMSHGNKIQPVRAENDMHNV